MCGIFGHVGYQSGPDAARALLEVMAAALVHRGPDDWGTYVDADAALGMTRLSIIDVAGGHQPMANEDGSIWIIFNGEIYNAPELRTGLAAAGHHFATRTDTECILHLYEDEGERCLDRLEGMFAFALWDTRRRTLFLARDRLGKKPLFYTRAAGGVLFGSEIKALLCHPQTPRGINPRALGTYLELNYTLAPWTMLQDVWQLLPGQAATYDVGLDKWQVWSYWEPQPGAPPPGGERVWAEAFRELLADAVRKRLLADVPLGAFLSGGIDSSSVVALMREAAPQRVRTFCLAFGEESYGEQAYAALAAHHIGTEHAQTMVPLDGLADELPTLAWYLDEPHADTAAVPQFYLSRFTRQHVTVALSGDGGDELLAGYETYLADGLRRWYRLLPRAVRSGVIGPLARRLPPAYRKGGLDYMARKFVEGAELDPDRAHYWWRTIFTGHERAAVIAPGLREEVLAHDPFDDFVALCPRLDDFRGVDRYLYMDLRTWLPNDILVKVDRASMGNSLEARCPFLDHRLVELTFRLPPEMKLRRWQKKYVLTRAMGDRLPPTIVRRRKRGFNAPVGVWFRRQLRTLLFDQLYARPAGDLEYFDRGTVRRLIEEHDGGRLDHGLKLWGLLMFDLWDERVRRRRPDATSHVLPRHPAAVAAG